MKDKPEVIKTVTGFLLNHEQIVFYIGKTHLAIEYFGPERITELKEKGSVHFVYYDYSQSDENFLEHIIGFKYDSSVKNIRFPVPQYSEDLILPTNAGFDKLRELQWNFAAQNSLIGFNSGNFYIPEGEFARIVNGLFFHSDEKGLKTRHIKWIDFLPLEYDDSNPDYDSFGINISILGKLVERDAHYVYPIPPEDDFKLSKLSQINRFIELTGSKETKEPQITKFLSNEKNKFILTMGFLAKDIHHQVECEWQSEEKDNIIPDFFIVRPNGYADIVEFKLPQTKGKTVVGRNNRETFSAEINSYISQTRTYRSYFDDPNNRNWVETKYGIKVYYPRRILVIGRRWDFSSSVWKEIITDYKDIEIMTYDELVDGVIAQFYM
ncbi:MAG: Shedu anti-phage system protein SduA domain-containing protein [Balneola sp.]